MILKAIGSCFLIAILVVAPISSWVVNLIKLTECDFESPYKCEVVHAVGIIGPVSLVTVWFDTDASQAETPTQ
jgi:hypothetical protein